MGCGSSRSVIAVASTSYEEGIGPRSMATEDARKKDKVPKRSHDKTFTRTLHINDLQSVYTRKKTLLVLVRVIGQALDISLGDSWISLVQPPFTQV